ncbi:hypothetical protein [Alicyclobacillus sp. ALC3]|uniref:hypothetical protein n=1 Tax=Alicyclobacillus sp. ALC3 TaxID=2796143 RepID=UPI0023793C74|nr:hypothetical protein [Alicyclobacillus sp. ALC3]WDL98877.1 hypothetical protein JC200_09585 [Alicyclobacillus sp. ALC3]
MKNKVLLGALSGLSLFTLVGCSSVNSVSNNGASTSSKSATQNTSANTSAQNSQTKAFTPEQQVQDIYRALQNIPKTPKAYVEAYLQAIATRSGSLARGYLAPSIRNQIPARVIGSSKWIGKWTITQTSSGNGAYDFHVVAYQYVLPASPKEKGSWMEAFHAKLTVQSEGYKHQHEPWLITAQQITLRKDLSF